MFKKKKKNFLYQNKIILNNGAVIYLFSVKYTKNKELNKDFFQDFNKKKKYINFEKK